MVSPKKCASAIKGSRPQSIRGLPAAAFAQPVGGGLTGISRDSRGSGEVRRVRPASSGIPFGYCEGDTLVIDTIGVKTDRPFAMVDMYGALTAQRCT